MENEPYLKWNKQMRKLIRKGWMNQKKYDEILRLVKDKNNSSC